MIVRGTALRFKARLPHSIGWTINTQTSQRTGGSALFEAIAPHIAAFFDMVCALHFTAPLPRWVFSIEGFIIIRFYEGFSIIKTGIQAWPQWMPQSLRAPI